MKVEKIEIKKEFINVELGCAYYFEVATKGRFARFMRDGEIPTETIDVERIEFRMRKVYNPETKTMKVLAVRVDQDELFSELIEVSKGLIEDKIRKGVSEFRQEFELYEMPFIRSAEYRRVWERLQKMPWWKRLFLTNDVFTENL